MILCWVDLCVWRLGSKCNTWSEFLIICHVILRHWLLASNLRPPIPQLCKRCSVLYWNLDNMSITHDNHYMNSKEWTRIIYAWSDHFNLSLGVRFFICSTELPKGTFILRLIVMDGCSFFSRPWRLCINSEYDQLSFLCQVWFRLCVMCHQPCYSIFQKFYSLMNGLYFLVYDVWAMLNIKSDYYNSCDAKGIYYVICQSWLRIMRLNLYTFKVVTCLGFAVDRCWLMLIHTKSCVASLHVLPDLVLLSITFKGFILQLFTFMRGKLLSISLTPLIKNNHSTWTDCKVSVQVSRYGSKTTALQIQWQKGFKLGFKQLNIKIDFQFGNLFFDNLFELIMARDEQVERNPPYSSNAHFQTAFKPRQKFDMLLFLSWYYLRRLLLYPVIPKSDLTKHNSIVQFWLRWIYSSTNMQLQNLMIPFVVLAFVYV